MLRAILQRRRPSLRYDMCMAGNLDNFVKFAPPGVGHPNTPDPLIHMKPNACFTDAAKVALAEYLDALARRWAPADNLHPLCDDDERSQRHRWLPELRADERWTRYNAQRFHSLVSDWLYAEVAVEVAKRAYACDDEAVVRAYCNHECEACFDVVSAHDAEPADDGYGADGLSSD